MLNYTSHIFRAYLASSVYSTNILQTAAQDLVFRLQVRHESKGRGSVSKPELYVGTDKEKKIWARDNDRAGLCFYTKDVGGAIRKDKIKSWLPAFAGGTSAERKKIITKYLSDYEAMQLDASSHDIDTNSNTSTPSKLDTPCDDSIYTAEMSDLDILNLYYDTKSVPDDAAATLIGEAQGRSIGSVSVPSSVIIEAKRQALSLRDDPWQMAPYIVHLCSVSGSTSQKRKRSPILPPVSDTAQKRKRSPTPSPFSDIERQWDQLIASGVPGMVEERERIRQIRERHLASLAEARNLVEQRAKMTEQELSFFG